jgi:ATP-dependent HslUV protease subunit HslV
VGAQAAATALMRHTQLDALQIAEVALQIASTLCVYTNHQLTIEELTCNAQS